MPLLERHDVLLDAGDLGFETLGFQLLLHKRVVEVGYGVIALGDVDYRRCPVL